MFSQRLKRVLESERVQRYTDVVLEPLDTLVRKFTERGHLPPLRIRRNSGALKIFETSAASVLGFVNGAIGVGQTDRILDIGCGSGAVALQLKWYLEAPGSYTGVDIHAPSITWARRNIAQTDPVYRFVLADLRSGQYNPNGSQTAEAYKFPFDDASFDLILAKSLFTHLRPPEVENYMSEIARLLAPHGHCFLTFFLLGPEREALIARGWNLTFPYGEGVWRYHDRDVPEHACAYDPEYVIGLLDRLGLELARPVFHGFQDSLIVRRSMQAS